MKRPLRVAVTGAAGQIGYSLLFRIASGEMLGKDQPVILQLLDITPAMAALNGVVMELDDCAFPLLQSIVASDDPKVAFRDVDVALLVGARPRSKGMERKDLLEANGAIFTTQGRALSEVASRDVKVLVVGNPANTNCYIAMRNAKDLKPANFSAMMRLDHNRSLTQIAQKVGKPVASVRKMTVWGNHSATSTRICIRPKSTVRKRPRSSTTRPGSKSSSYRPSSSAVRPSSRRADCRARRALPTPPWITSATGLRARARAIGSAWAFLPRAATAFPKA